MCSACMYLSLVRCWLLCLQMCMHTRAHEHGDQRLTSGVFLDHALLYTLRQGLPLESTASHLNSQLPNSRNSSEPACPGVPVSAPPTLGLQCAGRMLRSALQSSGLHSTCWAISPAQPLPSLFRRTQLLGLSNTPLVPAALSHSPLKAQTALEPVLHNCASSEVFPLEHPLIFCFLDSFTLLFQFFKKKVGS